MEALAKAERLDDLTFSIEESEEYLDIEIIQDSIHFTLRKYYNRISYTAEFTFEDLKIIGGKFFKNDITSIYQQIIDKILSEKFNLSVVDELDKSVLKRLINIFFIYVL